MSSNFLPEFKPFDPDREAAGLTRKSTIGEQAVAAWKLSLKSGETSSIYRMAKNASVEREDDIVDHNILNEQHLLPIPLNEPMSQAKADRLFEEDIERKQLQSIIQNGRGTTFENFVNFGAGVGAQMVDPVGALSGILTGTLVGKILAKAALGIRAAKAGAGAAKAAKVATKAGLGRRVAEGVTGNVIAEAAFVIPASIQEHQDINTFDNLKNAIYGGVAFPVALKSLNLGYKGMAKLFNHTEQRMASGKKPFGSPAELEAVTGTERAALEAKKEELLLENESLRRDQDLKKVDEQIKDIDEELSDEVGLRERANADDQDLYSDQEIRQEVKQELERGDIQEVEITPTERVDSEFEQQIRAEETAEGKANLVAEQELYIKKKTAVPEVADTLAGCFGVRFTGSTLG